MVKQLLWVKFIKKKFLSGWNLVYEAVETGKEALEAVARTHLDLVLVQADQFLEEYEDLLQKSAVDGEKITYQEADKIQEFEKIIGVLRDLKA